VLTGRQRKKTSSNRCPINNTQHNNDEKSAITATRSYRIIILCNPPVCQYVQYVFVASERKVVKKSFQSVALIDSTEILSSVAQLYEKCHLKILSISGRYLRSLKVVGIAAIREVIYHFLLVVCSNNVSILHGFLDIITSTVYVTPSELLQFPLNSRNYEPRSLSASHMNIS